MELEQQAGEDGRDKRSPGGMPHRAWDVYLNGRLIDTVFYDRSCTADYVRNGLINHDGYNPRIRVKGGE